MVSRSSLRALTLLVVPLGALGCSTEAGTPRADGTEARVNLVRVDTATMAVPVSIPAQLYVEHDAILYARSTGVVESVKVDVGSRVQPGQILAQLEQIDQEIALAEARHANTNARHVVERYRELGGKGVVSVADSEQAELEYERTELALRQARRNYDLTQITTPFGGAVTARMVRSGRLVAPGDSLFRVTELFPLLVSVHVPQTSAGSIKVGDDAEVIGLGGRRVDAVVKHVSPAIDAASGTRQCILRLASGSGLLPGASVEVRIGAERRTVLAVPPDVLSEGGFVLVWEQGRTVLRAVTVGQPLNDGRIEIVSGLAPGEQVVRAGT